MRTWCGVSTSATGAIGTAANTISAVSRKIARASTAKEWTARPALCYPCGKEPMKPVDQTTYDAAGNCMSACIASILELSVEVVPLFIGEGWWSHLLWWLAARNLSATKITVDRAPPGYTLAFGPSTRLHGLGHVCVALHGIVVHDPHPSRDGLPIVDYYVAIHGPRGEPLWFNGIHDT